MLEFQFLKCLAESSQHKSSVVDVADMRSGDKATKTGKLFYDTLKVKMFNLITLEKTNVDKDVDKVGTKISIFCVISLSWPQIDWSKNP